MDKIKTKSTIRDIKILDKAADVAQNAKNAAGHIHEQAEPQQKNNDNYVEHTVGKTKESVKTAVQKTSQIAQNQGKKAAQKIRERWKANRVSNESDGATFRKSNGTGERGRDAASSRQRNLAKQRFLSERVSRNGGKTLRKTAGNTVKAPAKTVKTERTTKTAIKTSQAVAKAAVRSAQTGVRAAQRTVQAARAAVVAARATVKAVIAMVKAAIAAIRSLIALIAAGGWVALVIILVICLVAFLVHSPLGIFFSGEDKDANVTPVANIVQEVNADFTAKIS
ncbi:MAG: hypothetical protein WCP73_09265, partial [Eubacteriales bacterium]